MSSPIEICLSKFRQANRSGGIDASMAPLWAMGINKGLTEESRDNWKRIYASLKQTIVEAAVSFLENVLEDKEQMSQLSYFRPFLTVPDDVLAHILSFRVTKSIYWACVCCRVNRQFQTVVYNNPRLLKGIRLYVEPPVETLANFLSGDDIDEYYIKQRNKRLVLKRYQSHRSIGALFQVPNLSEYRRLRLTFSLRGIPVVLRGKRNFSGWREYGTNQIPSLVMEVLLQSRNVALSNAPDLFPEAFAGVVFDQAEKLTLNAPSASLQPEQFPNVTEIKGKFVGSLTLDEPWRRPEFLRKMTHVDFEFNVESPPTIEWETIGEIERANVAFGRVRQNLPRTACLPPCRYLGINSALLSPSEWTLDVSLARDTVIGLIVTAPLEMSTVRDWLGFVLDSLVHVRDVVFVLPVNGAISEDVRHGAKRLTLFDVEKQRREIVIHLAQRLIREDELAIKDFIEKCCRSDVVDVPLKVKVLCFEERNSSLCEYLTSEF